MKTKKSKLTSVNHRSKTSKQIKARIRIARPIHKRVLLHPSTGFLLIVIGMFLSLITYRTLAANLTITATVSAPPVTSPATIFTPLNNAKFVTSPIDVTGTCPVNSRLDLTRNGIFSGTTSCGSNSKFSILTDLSVGTNELYIRSYNITNQEGPESNRISVTYTKPKVSTISKLIIITSSLVNQVYASGSPTIWEIKPQGGLAPYAITVKWSDGTDDVLVRSNDESFKISHTYFLNDSSSKVFNIYIKVVDSQGTSALIQLSANIKKNNDAAAIGSLNGGSGSTFMSKVKNILIVSWPIYAATILLAASYWLGERAEYHVLVKSMKHIKRVNRIRKLRSKK